MKRIVLLATVVVMAFSSCDKSSPKITETIGFKQKEITIEAGKTTKIELAGIGAFEGKHTFQYEIITDSLFNPVRLRDYTIENAEIISIDKGDVTKTIDVTATASNLPNSTKNFIIKIKTDDPNLQLDPEASMIKVSIDYKLDLKKFLVGNKLLDFEIRNEKFKGTKFNTICTPLVGKSNNPFDMIIRDKSENEVQMWGFPNGMTTDWVNVKIEKNNYLEIPSNQRIRYAISDETGKKSLEAFIIRITDTNTLNAKYSEEGNIRGWVSDGKLYLEPWAELALIYYGSETSRVFQPPYQIRKTVMEQL